MKRKVHEYASEAVRVRYDVKRCIHAAECVHRLPMVFDPKRRPWVDPTRASADDVTAVIERCPTGALHYERLDGGDAERTPEVNSVTVSPNGPLYVRGQISVRSPGGETLLDETRVALCRCGASANKPLCDGAHEKAGFSDSGRVPGDHDPPAAGTGPLVVSLAAHGPLLLKGVFRLVDGAGAALPARGKAALCRCGQSASKPFCDGAHARVGFRAE